MFVILILFASIAVLMYLKNSERPEPDSAECERSESSLTSIDGEKVCSSESCVKAAAEILNSVDPKVDPCQDFYGFVCNGWIQNNPIPKVRLDLQANYSLTVTRLL